MSTEGIITAIISTLISAVAYFVTRWLEGVNKQLDELETLLDELTKKVSDMERAMVTKPELHSVLRRKEISSSQKTFSSTPTRDTRRRY